jgi:AcrR family transcriptional regulator
MPENERSRGRPADTKAGALQAQLLDAAEELFAEHGYAATPLRRVAERARVNPALVHYYFESKLGLLQAVLDRALEPMAATLAAMRSTAEPDIPQIAKLMFGMAGKHPALPRLIVREVMLSGGEMQDLFIEHYAPRLGGALPGLIRRGQLHGDIDPEYDPGTATLMLLSLCMFPFVARAIAEPQLGIRYDEAGRQAYLAQLARLLERGMSP